MMSVVRKSLADKGHKWKEMGLVVLPVLVLMLSFPLGRYPITLAQLITILAAKVFPLSHTWPATLDTVIFQVRLPRIMAAMLVGAALATAGAAYIGIKWLANLLYPNVFRYDMAAEAKDFYAKFYHYNLRTRR